jgi:hypothetical protein
VFVLAKMRLSVHYIYICESRAKLTYSVSVDQLVSKECQIVPLTARGKEQTGVYCSEAIQHGFDDESGRLFFLPTTNSKYFSLVRPTVHIITMPFRRECELIRTSLKT